MKTQEAAFFDMQTSQKGGRRNKQEKLHELNYDLSSPKKSHFEVYRFTRGCPGEKLRAM
jgi:hypothetical protein